MKTSGAHLDTSSVCGRTLAFILTNPCFSLIRRENRPSEEYIIKDLNNYAADDLN